MNEWTDGLTDKQIQGWQECLRKAGQTKPDGWFDIVEKREGRLLGQPLLGHERGRGRFDKTWSTEGKMGLGKGEMVHSVWVRISVKCLIVSLRVLDFFSKASMLNGQRQWDIWGKREKNIQKHSWNWMKQKAKSKCTRAALLLVPWYCCCCSGGSEMNWSFNAKILYAVSSFVGREPIWTRTL